MIIYYHHRNLKRFLEMNHIFENWKYRIFNFQIRSRKALNFFSTCIAKVYATHTRRSLCVVTTDLQSIKTLLFFAWEIIPTLFSNEFSTDPLALDIFAWDSLFRYVTNGFTIHPVFLEFFASMIFSPYLRNLFHNRSRLLPFALRWHPSQTKPHHHVWRPFVTSVTHPPLP